MKYTAINRLLPTVIDSTIDQVNGSVCDELDHQFTLASPGTTAVIE